MKEYRIESSSLIHSNFLRHCMACDRDTFNKRAQDEAAKLYMLVAAFPQLPAGDLMAIVKGEAEIEYFENHAIVRVPAENWNQGGEEC